MTAPPGTSSSRTPVDYLDRLERCSPGLPRPASAEPILHTGEGAKVYRLDRARSTCSPAKRMQRDTLPGGHRRGPPHGLAGHHQVGPGWTPGEICVVLLWHPSLARDVGRRGATPTPGRTTPGRRVKRGAPAPRRARIPIRAVTESQGGRGLPREERRRQRRPGHQHRAVLGSGQGRALTGLPDRDGEEGARVGRERHERAECRLRRGSLFP